MRALAIDDDKDFLNLIEVYLKQIGYTTSAILDAEGILTAITQETYDLVLVDWMMPDVDGITVIKAIRTRDKHTGNNTKVIMVTAIIIQWRKPMRGEAGRMVFSPNRMIKMVSSSVYLKPSGAS